MLLYASLQPVGACMYVLNANYTYGSCKDMKTCIQSSNLQHTCLIHSSRYTNATEADWLIQCLPWTVCCSSAVQDIPCCYETRRLITVTMYNCRLNLHLILSVPPQTLQPVLLRLFFMSSFHLYTSWSPKSQLSCCYHFQITCLIMKMDVFWDVSP